MGSDPFRNAVRATAEDLKRRLLDPEAPVKPTPEPPTIPAAPPLLPEPSPIPVQPQAAVPTLPPETPEELETFIQSQLSKPNPPSQAEIPKPAIPEDRQALEAVLGITAPAASGDPEDIESLIQSEFTKPVEAPAQKKASPEPPPPARPAVKAAAAPPGPVVIPEPPSKAGLLAVRGLSFCWTGLLGVLSMTDRAMPAPLKARKTLLGRIGMAATLAAMLGLVGWACMRVAVRG